MQDIHEIKPPILVGMDPALAKILAIAAVCLVLAGALFFLFRKFWKRKRSGKEEIPAPPVPPYEEALKGLESLASRRDEDPKVFYFELGALLKIYISRSHAIHATEMTTQELARQLRTTAMDRNLVTRVVRFQDITDPFRYGPVIGDPGRTRQDLEEARQLIESLEQDLEKTREPEPEQDKGKTVRSDRQEKQETRMSVPYTKILDSKEIPLKRENT